MSKEFGRSVAVAPSRGAAPRIGGAERSVGASFPRGLNSKPNTGPQIVAMIPGRGSETRISSGVMSGLGRFDAGRALSQTDSLAQRSLPTHRFASPAVSGQSERRIPTGNVINSVGGRTELPQFAAARFARPFSASVPVEAVSTPSPRPQQSENRNTPRQPGSLRKFDLARDTVATRAERRRFAGNVRIIDLPSRRPEAGIAHSVDQKPIDSVRIAPSVDARSSLIAQVEARKDEIRQQLKIEVQKTVRTNNDSVNFPAEQSQMIGSQNEDVSQLSARFDNANRPKMNRQVSGTAMQWYLNRIDEQRRLLAMKYEEDKKKKDTSDKKEIGSLATVKKMHQVKATRSNGFLPMGFILNKDDEEEKKRLRLRQSTGSILQKSKEKPDLTPIIGVIPDAVAGVKPKITEGIQTKSAVLATPQAVRSEIQTQTQPQLLPKVEVERLAKLNLTTILSEQTQQREIPATTLKVAQVTRADIQTQLQIQKLSEEQIMKMRLGIDIFVAKKNKEGDYIHDLNASKVRKEQARIGATNAVSSSPDGKITGKDLIAATHIMTDDSISGIVRDKRHLDGTLVLLWGRVARWEAMARKAILFFFNQEELRNKPVDFGENGRKVSDEDVKRVKYGGSLSDMQVIAS